MKATIIPDVKNHYPALLNELISIITPQYGGTFIDCTFGQGGYTKKILEFPKTKVIGLDRDSESKKKADKISEKIEVYHEKIKYIISIIVLLCFISTTIFFVKRDLRGSALDQVTTSNQPSAFEKKILEIAQVSRSMNAYGLFRVMTKTRPEIKIELQSENGEWHPVIFKYKPGDERKRPLFIFPHMPRLDWQIWFEALYY